MKWSEWEILVRTESWPLDPRLSDLGRRTVIEGEPGSSQSAASLYGREYRHWRIEHGVAEGPEEIPAGAGIAASGKAKKVGCQE